jgi:hemoglobin
MEGQKAKPVSRAGQYEEPSVAKKSLYDRMGGEPVIIKVVDDLVLNVVADPMIKEKHKKHFIEGDVPVLKKKLVDQIGEATGGPQKYTGKNMKDAHKNMGITDEDFNALAGDVAKALDKNNVGAAEKKELLDMLGTMRKDVVESKSE